MKKRYRYEIRPTEEQKVFLEKNFGCCRYVYNRGLAEAKLEYENWLAQKDAGIINQLKPTSTGYDFCAKLPIYKTDPNCLWLNEPIAAALQQSMLDLGTAYSEFFRKRKGYPQYKKKVGKQSFSLPKIFFKITDKDLYIAKLDTPIKVIWSRDLSSSPSSLTISKTPASRYYVSFVCEYVPQRTYGTKLTGLDLGLSTYVTLSDGSKIENPRILKQYEQQLRRVHQTLSRKDKGSQNRTKARLKLAKLYERISFIRNDHLHKLSRRLVNENQVIGLEALVVRNMVKNRRLAKSVSDASWGTFKRLLTYKTIESQHATIVLMDTYYPSSQICSTTGQRLDRKLKLSERMWNCPYCHQAHDRDVNAAINIRNEAVRAYRELGSSGDTRILLANNRY